MVKSVKSVNRLTGVKVYLEAEKDVKSTGGSAKSLIMSLVIVATAKCRFGIGATAISMCSVASPWCADWFHPHYCMPQVLSQPLLLF